MFRMTGQKKGNCSHMCEQLRKKGILPKGVVP